MRIPSGVTDQYIYFVAVDATDFSSRETGLSSFTVYRSRNGGASAVMTTPTINETDTTNMPGVYELLLDEDMTIGAGNDSEEMVFHITHAGMAPVTRTIELYRPKITAGNTLGVASDGDLLEVNTLTGHTVQTGDSFARIGAAGASLTAVPWNAAWDAEVESEVTDALNVYDPPTKAELDAGFAALNDPTAATIADAVWDEALSGHQTAGTAGRNLTLAGTILSETTLTGTPTTTVFRLTAGSATDDFYNDMEIIFISGNAAGLSRIISDYDGTNKDVTVDEALPVTPTASDAVVIKTVHKHSKSQIADAIWDENIVAAHTTIDTAGRILANTRNLSVGAGGISAVAGSATITTGSETLTYTSTQELDGTTHDIAPSVGNTEFYYEFDVGVTGVCTEVIWHGHAEANGDSYTIKGYDWVSASYKTVGTIVANNATAITSQVFIFTVAMTGTGANAGKVRFQVTSSDGTNFSTDYILAEYTSLPEAGVILHSGVAQAGSSNTITLDAGASALDDFYNHARVVISSGTGLEQERIIADYNGTTKVATVAPPWVTTPDSTSAFEVEPALTHAETGWATIKVGLTAAATSTTITLDSTASAVDDYYNGDLLHIDAGTGEGQTRYITDYVGSTKVATISPAWITTPDTTSEYIVEEGHPYIDAKASDIETDTQDIQSRLPSALVGGKMDSDVTAIGGNTTSATNLSASALGIVTGACEGVPSTTVIQTDLAEATDDHYIGRVVVFTSGAAANQATDITDYTGSTGTITVTALTTAPSATDTFVIV